MAAEGVRPRLLRALGWAVRAVVALALLGALASMAGLGSSGALAGLSWPPLLLGLLVTPFAVLIRAFNHTLLANRRVRIMRLRDALGLALVGAGLGLILPAGASDAARAHYGFRMHGHAEDMIVSTVLDRLTSLTAVAAMGIVGGVMVAEYGLAALAGAVFAATLVPFVVPAARVWRLILTFLAPGHAPDDDALRYAMRPPAGRLLLVVGVSVVGWLATYAIVGLVCAAVGARVQFGSLMALAPFTSLARMVPISVGGLGLSEFTMAALLIRSGVPAALAAQTSLISMALLVLVPGATGLILVLVRRHQRASVIGSDGEAGAAAEVS